MLTLPTLMVGFGFLWALVVLLPSRGHRYLGWLAAVPAVAWLGVFVAAATGVLARTQWVAPWVPELGLAWAWRIDGLAVLFGGLIAAIGTLIMLYGGSYLIGDAARGRVLAWLVVFMNAMVGMAVADNVVLFFIFWEITSIASYILIGTKYRTEAARRSARQAILVTGAGGLALLAGFVVLGLELGAWRFSALAQVPVTPAATGALVLIVLGAATKSAQWPFHFWLPAAMVAPTPISAYLHSATMVKAGVFLLMRMHPAFAGWPLWSALLVPLGAWTALYAVIVGVAQTDLKRLLAYSTLSILGTLVALVGVGSTKAAAAALVLLFAHAFYKGALFMIAGGVDKATGTRDVRDLRGLRAALPVAAIAGLVAAASMIGLPPLVGFAAKEVLLASLLSTGHAWALAALALAALGMVAIALRVVWAPFFGAHAPTPASPKRIPAEMLAGPVVLAAGSLLAGVALPLVGQGLFAPAVLSMQPQGVIDPGWWHLWHGIHAPLVISVVVVLGGFALFGARRRVDAVAARMHLPSGGRLFESLYAGTVRFAEVITNRLQHEHLAGYITTVLVVLIGLLVVPLVRTLPVDWTQVAMTPVVPLGVLALTLVVVGALGAVGVTTTIAAVLSVGATGMGVALTYLLFGAPDLALTQIVVEVLTLIVLALVLRHLANHGLHRRLPVRLLHGAVAAAVGAFMGLMVLDALQAAEHQRISTFFAANSWIQAHGRNVVNVILVDFRALDTLGEITVLAIAAAGITAMLRPVSPAVVERQAQVASPILSSAAKLLVALMLVVAVYFFSRGHNAPGGGFIAALIAAAGVAMVQLAEPHLRPRDILRVRSLNLMLIGLAIAALAGVLGMLAGEPFLTGIWATGKWPVVGKLGSPILFDLGVFLVVVGVVTGIVRRAAET